MVGKIVPKRSVAAVGRSGESEVRDGTLAPGHDCECGRGELLVCAGCGATGCLSGPFERGPISTRTRSCKAPWQCADCLARTDAPALERPAASTAMEEDCVPVAGKRDNARLELAAPSRKRTRQASPETAGEQGNDGSTTKRAHKELSSKQGGAKGSSDGAGRGKGRGHVGKAACGLGAQQRGSGMGSCANEGNAAAATLPRARTRMRTRADDRTGSTEHVTTRDGAGPLTATATDDDCKVEDHTASPDAPSLPVASRRGVHDSSGGRVTMTKAPAAPTPRDASHASVQPRTAQEASLWRHVGLQLLVLPDMQPRPPKRSRGKTGTAHTDGGINLGFSDLDREHTATEHTATYGPGATEPTQTQPASTLLRPESPRERVHVLLFNLNALRGGVEPWEQCGGCGNYVALPRTTLSASCRICKATVTPDTLLDSLPLMEDLKITHGDHRRHGLRSKGQRQGVAGKSRDGRGEGEVGNARRGGGTKRKGARSGGGNGESDGVRETIAAAKRGDDGCGDGSGMGSGTGISCGAGAGCQSDSDGGGAGEVAGAELVVEAEHWVQCDVCQKWRKVDAECARRAGEGGEWRCSALGHGASCDAADDWLSQQARLQRSMGALGRNRAKRAERKRRDARVHEIRDLLSAMGAECRAARAELRNRRSKMAVGSGGAGCGGEGVGVGVGEGGGEGEGVAEGGCGMGGDGVDGVVSAGGVVNKDVEDGSGDGDEGGLEGWLVKKRTEMASLESELADLLAKGPGAKGREMAALGAAVKGGGGESDASSDWDRRGRVGCASKAGHRGGGSLAGLARVLKGLHDEGRLGHALGNAVGTRERVRVAMGVGAEGRVWVQVAVVGEVDVTTEAAVLARSLTLDAEGDDFWEACDVCGSWVPLTNMSDNHTTGKTSNMEDGGAEGEMEGGTPAAEGGSGSGVRAVEASALWGQCRCGATVRFKGAGEGTDHWASCDACGKWRAVTPQVSALCAKVGGRWTCAMLVPGATCRATQGDWAVRARAMRVAAVREASIEATPGELAGRVARVGVGQAVAIARAFPDDDHALSSLHPIDIAAIDAHDMSDGTNVDADDVDNAVMASATHSVMQGSWCVGNASASGSVRGVARVDVDEREEGTFAEGLQPRALFEGRDGGEVAGEVGAEAAGVSGHDQAESPTTHAGCTIEGLTTPDKSVQCNYSVGGRGSDGSADATVCAEPWAATQRAASDAADTERAVPGVTAGSPAALVDPSADDRNRGGLTQACPTKEEQSPSQRSCDCDEGPTPPSVFAVPRSHRGRMVAVMVPVKETGVETDMLCVTGAGSASITEPGMERVTEVSTEGITEPGIATVDVPHATPRTATAQGVTPCHATPAHPTAHNVTLCVHVLSEAVPTHAAFCEFVPGRDMVFAPDTAAMGIDLMDRESGEHVLSTRRLPPHALACARGPVLHALSLWHAQRMPPGADGRASAGPIDLPTYLATPDAQAQVVQALHRRRARLESAGIEPTRDNCAATHVVHVHPDGRRVFIGDEHDVTAHGGNIMAFNKAWKSAPIRSWSGGFKLADLPGAIANRVVRNRLSDWMGPHEAGVHETARAVWAAMLSVPHTREAAHRMVEYLDGTALRRATRIPGTGFNAYSLNIDYRTGRHVDGKNMPGSYSALLIVETGEPFLGGFYMAPQFRVGFDLRQGCVLFHRSGDPHVGVHGNAALHLPEPSSHRVALVFYCTELRDGGGVGGGAGGDVVGAATGVAGGEATGVGEGGGAVEVGEGGGVGGGEGDGRGLQEGRGSGGGGGGAKVGVAAATPALRDSTVGQNGGGCTKRKVPSDGGGAEWMEAWGWDAPGVRGKGEGGCGGKQSVGGSQSALAQGGLGPAVAGRAGEGAVGKSVGAGGDGKGGVGADASLTIHATADGSYDDNDIDVCGGDMAYGPGTLPAAIASLFKSSGGGRRGKGAAEGAVGSAGRAGVEGGGKGEKRRAGGADGAAVPASKRAKKSTRRYPRCGACKFCMNIHWHRPCIRNQEE